jgi:hypothetical protein
MGGPAPETATGTATQPAAPPRPLGRRLLAALWPVAVFTVLTVIMTWPLVTDLQHGIIYGITADADVSRWDLWWFKTALLERHSNPFYTDMLYYPYRLGANALPLYFHTLQPLNGLLALPVLLLTDDVVGPTFAYNLLLLGHMILTGCAMFWLVRYLTGSAAGALVAGIVFTFGAFHQYHIHEAQLELIPLEWLPLFVLFLHRLLYGPPERKRRVLNGVLAVAVLVATALTSWYLTLYLLMIGGLLALVRLVERPREWRATLGATAAVMLAWGVLAGPFLYATIRSSADPNFQLVSGLDYEVRFSLSPLDLFTVSKDVRMDPAVWFLGPLGWSALVLGAVGAWRLRRRAVVWGILIGVGAILALGPYLQWDAAIDVNHTTGVPLPYLLLRNLPFLSIARVPRRFVVLADLGLDVLAGAGAAYLVAWARQAATRLRRVWAPRAAAGAMLGVLALVPLLELAVIPQPLRPVYFSPFFSRLAAEPGDFAILELPVTSHYLRDHSRMINQTVHHKKIIGGYVARRVHDYYRDPASPFYQFLDLKTKPQPDIVPPLSPFAVLNYYNMPYIVVYKVDEGYEQPGDKEAVDAYVRYLFPDRSAVVADDQQLTAYRVPATPGDEPLIWAGGGWNAPDSNAGRTWRWSNGQDASIHIITKTPLTWHLRFTAQTYRGAATLDVALNGQPVGQAALRANLQGYDLGTITLPAGENEITFHSSTPAIAPSEIGADPHDARKLGFLLTDLQFK